MGGIARCCCCPTCAEFSTSSASFTWLDKSFTHDLSEIDQISCSSIVCVSDPSWTEWHDEAEVTPWGFGGENVGSVGCDFLCNSYGAYVTQELQIQEQWILRFKTWMKRRWSTQLFVEKCETGVRFKVIARLIYLWPFNATLTIRDRYRINEQQCNPASPVVTGAWVEYGTDDGCEPGFPPGSYPELYGCAAETWTEGNCDACDESETVTINLRFNCTDVPTSRTVGVESSCNNCPDLLIPNRNRTPLILGEWEYFSECYECGYFPTTFDLEIPGCTGPINFNAYGNPFSSNYVVPCDFANSFPASPVVSIPCTISLTLA